MTGWIPRAEALAGPELSPGPLAGSAPNDGSGCIPGVPAYYAE